MKLRQRNLGIIAHVDAGKTTLTERVLYYTGKVRNIGEVHHGAATTDALPQERDKGITISAASVSCSWKDHRLTIIDTPGHVDFTIEVERSLRVLDGAVVVFDSVAGVEAQTETVWRQADRYGVPRICFVNKMDRPGANFEACVDEIRTKLGARPAVVGLPVFRGADLAMLDVVALRALTWSDEKGESLEATSLSGEELDRAMQLREQLIELCADVDDRLAELYLAGDVTELELRAALRRATLSGALTPVLGGSAFKNRGVQPLLDAVIELLPAPEDRPAVRGVDGEVRPPSEDAPLAGLVFKVVHHEHGQLSFVRVYSGVLQKGTKVLNPRSNKRLVVGRLARMFVAHRETIERAGAGEIAVLLGQNLRTGDTLCAPEAPITLESLHAPEPVVRLAIEPKTFKDHDRFQSALLAVTTEDPSLKLESDPETGQTLLAGVGELHLEIAIDRLKTEHRLSLKTGAPRVAYRETVFEEITIDVRHVKQSGGPGQFACLTLKVGPAPSGAGLVLSDRSVGGSVPVAYVPAIEAGLREAMDFGGPHRYPLVDLAVTIVDGAHHATDSSPLAFKLAASKALRTGLHSTRLLEPVMIANFDVPDVSTGAVVSDLGGRRGRIKSLTPQGGRQHIEAQIPLSECFGYANHLRGLTGGRGSMNLTLAGYEAVPPKIAEQILTA